MTMPKLEKRENYRSTYEKYKNQDINLIYKIVYGWLFEYRHHREMDINILGIEYENDNSAFRGEKSNKVLLYLGLDKNLKNYFEENNLSVEEAISELKNTGDAEYLDLIDILENILKIEEKDGIAGSEEDEEEEEEEEYNQIVSTDELNDLSFNDAFKIVSAILLEKNGIEIKADDYDGLLAKQLSDTDPITENRSPDKDGEPTHIAITGQQRNMFPYLMSYGYFTEIEYNTDFKSYFVFKAPVFLNNSNLNYLYDNIENERLNEQYITTGRNPFESIGTYLENLDEQIEYYKSKGQKFETSVSVLRSRKLPRAREYASENERKCDRRQDQIELSQKNTDGKAFLLLRKLLFGGDYLIILKQKTEPKYDMYGIKNEDAGELSKLLKKYFYNYVSNNKSTSVPPHMFETNLDNITRNKIYFGAPGTGKSYTLNQQKDEIIPNDEHFERVTFHPDYSYANFVGTYKPIMKENEESEKKEITYDFVPGPFLRVFVKAMKNKIEAKDDKSKLCPFLLIIEEINRANVSAVFGDVFQLLDRDENNESEYSINVSEDIRNHLIDKFNEELENGFDEEDYEIYFPNNEIKIPSNMFIWATMNSADQGVFPIDTAFKRRWDFEYISIDNNKKLIKNLEIESKKGNYYWNDIREEINKFLLKEDINEDKLMGPFFIKENPNKNFTQLFKDKVLMYLYEDAAKPIRERLFAGSKKTLPSFSYLNICNDFTDNGTEIFHKEIFDNIKPIDEDSKKLIKFEPILEENEEI